VCEEENIKPKDRRMYKLPHDEKFYVDTDKLFSVILDRQHYNFLRNTLGETVGSRDYNTRDRITLELAWEGLTAIEIKNLKKDKDSIIFKKINEKEVADLVLDDRIVTITDEDVVEDLKKTIDQTHYYVSSTGKKKEAFKPYRDTPYLIRPVSYKTGKNLQITNPSQMLKNILVKMDGGIPDIDLSLLTLEDVRRSRAIEMFCVPNTTIEDVKEFLGKDSTCDLYWLKEIAEKKNKMIKK